MNQIPNHVAILVPSVKKASIYLRQFGFQIGEEEQFDGEGTREIYVESGLGNSLLLMEPLDHGPYRRAMEKRGPGLHHIAVDVLDLNSFIDSLSGSGWLLHPMSIKTISHSKTAYLARPGFPGLIEVQERSELSTKTFFVNKVTLKMDSSLIKLLKPIGLDKMIETSLSDETILLGEKMIQLKNLF
ncbi:MAG: VOC family protein [Bacteriovorax sp.]|jgi:methylmalonyl-CoA/ethylmalonyl-CoA epimerase